MTDPAQAQVDSIVVHLTGRIIDLQKSLRLAENEFYKAVDIKRVEKLHALLVTRMSEFSLVLDQTEDDIQDIKEQFDE